MSANPSVSIQVCARNAAPFLREALDSAFQTASALPDVEILYCDDASTDESLEIAAAFARENASLRILRSETCEGIAASSAKAALATDAEFILKLDGDDLLVPGHLAAQLERMRGKPTLGAVYGKRLVVDEMLNPAGTLMGMPFSRFNMSFYNMISSGGVLIRRSLLLEAGCYRVPQMGAHSTGEDFDLWWRLAAIADFDYIDDFLNIYRKNPGQMTARKDNGFHENHEWMRSECLALNSALTALLKESPNEPLPPESRRKAMLILGVLAFKASGDNALSGRYAKAACALDPSDYGAQLAFFDCLAASGAVDDALELCRPLAVDDAVFPFVRMKAAEAAANLLSSLGRSDEASQWNAIAMHFKRSLALDILRFRAGMADRQS